MVLIGIPDSRVSHRHKTSSLTNKIGGLPDWPDKDKHASPSCQLCGQLQSLVVQLYCPLEFSFFHRTLYVFACPNPSCWNKEESWTVYRCQRVDDSFKPVHSCVDDISDCGTGANDWGDNANDWGDNANDWGDDANDWGDNANDWGDAMDELDSSIKELKDSASSGKFEASSEHFCPLEKDSVVTDVRLDDCSSGMEQMSIEHRTESASGESDDTSVITENMPSISDDEKSRILKSFNTTKVSECRVLNSYHINVFEEPTNQFENNSHVTKLLKDYQKREGFTTEDFMEGESSKGSEKYEKSALVHKDVIFHKFTKRLSMCPEQCIRYEWNGSPLFNCVPSVDVPRRCSHCNSETVFELQLTPALVNHLKVRADVEDDSSEGVAVEFGTVIIYSCQQSCWEEGDVYRTENKIVLPDPDQHLFT